jgi:hypothetical protein
MQARRRFARVEDVHELALGMSHVKVEHGPSGNPVYQVGGKSFVFFRNPRPDAVDPETGERYTDVIVFWVAFACPQTREPVIDSLVTQC